MIHTQDLRFLWEHCLLARVFQGKKLVVSTHGFILHQKKALWLKRLVFRFYLKPLFRLADSLLASSPQDFDKVKDRYQSPQLERFDLGVDTTRFASVRPRPQPGELLYFGRLDRHKGVDLLFQALSRVSKAYQLHLVFGAASPGYREELESMAQSLGIASHLVWHGALNHADLCQRLETAQFVVLPSRYEGFGLKTLEAMSAGAVPIANRIQAFEHIITDGKNGFLVDFENSEEAGVALSRCLDLKLELQEKMQIEARDRAADYRWDRRIDQLRAVYSRVLGGAPC
jgi:glycosyltransferase involved in cell wall biosynthesis